MAGFFRDKNFFAIFACDLKARKFQTQIKQNSLRLYYHYISRATANRSRSSLGLCIQIATFSNSYVRLIRSSLL